MYLVKNSYYMIDVFFEFLVERVHAILKKVIIVKNILQMNTDRINTNSE